MIKVILTVLAVIVILFILAAACDWAIQTFILDHYGSKAYKWYFKHILRIKD